MKKIKEINFKGIAKKEGKNLFEATLKLVAVAIGNIVLKVVEDYIS